MRPIKDHSHILNHAHAQTWFDKVLMTFPDGTLLPLDKTHLKKINIPDLLSI